MKDLTKNGRTAYQWIMLGFVPKQDAVFYQIDKSYTNYKGERIESNYYYCNLSDCEQNREVAKELLKTAPLLQDCYTNGGTYDGRPWWTADIEKEIDINI